MKLFTCSAYSSLLMNQLSCKVRLDIQYSPVIDIRRKLTKTKIILTCYPSGNPANYTFGDWEHWSEFDEHIRNVHGTSGGTLIMKYTTDNKLDGVYKCKTSNGIYGTNGNLYQKGSILINNKVPPKFFNSNKQIQFGRYGKEMNLTALVYNKYGTLRTNLLQRNKTINVHELQKSINIQEIVHDVNITLACIKIIFQLTLNKIEDCTDYTIEACNKKGCNKLMVKIKLGNRPEPPTNVSVIPFERYLTVLWYRGYNGGFPQTFFIEYREEKKEFWRRSDPLIDNKQTRISNILSNLSPQTGYRVRLLSANAIGESDKTAVTLIMTLAIHSTDEQSASDHGIVIVVLVLVTIVIGAGIGIVVRFLKQKTKKRIITAANVQASKASIDDINVYEDINEEENHQTSLQENENPILSTVNTVGVEKGYKDTVSSENALVASDNSIEDVDNDGAIYAQPYKSMVVQYCADEEDVNIITKQSSIYENENSLDNSAYEVIPEFLQDTLPEDQTLPVYEYVNQQTSSQENENQILSTRNIIGVDKKDDDTLSSENGSVLSDNNDGMYEQPYASLVVPSPADNGNVYLITKQNSLYENETYLDNSASEISSEFLQDTSPVEQELPVYENLVEEEAYFNCIADDIA